MLFALVAELSVIMLLLYKDISTTG